MNIFLLKITSNGLLAGMMAVFCCSMGNAQISYSNSLAGATLIYSNAFDGAAVNITNTPPNLAVSLFGGTNTAVWIDAGGTGDTGAFYANGDVGTPQGDSILLPFKPQPNHVYTLTASVTFSGNPGNWVGVGFAQNYATPGIGNARFADSGVNGYDFVILTESSGNVQFFGGPHATVQIFNQNGFFSANAPATHTMKLILDTTGAKWAAACFVDGVPAGTNQFTYASNPAIAAVGISQNAFTTGGQVNVRWNSLTFSAVPLAILQPPASASVAAGAVLTNTIVVAGGAPVSYQWYFNSSSNYSGASAVMNSLDGRILGGGTNTLVITNVHSGDAGYYYVVATNSLGSLTSTLASLTVSTNVTTNAPIQLTSPDGSLMLTFVVSNFDGSLSCPVYSVARNGQPLIATSKLGLTFGAAGLLRENLTLLSQTNSANDSTWQPVYAEKSQIRDNYNQLVVNLQEAAPPGRLLQLTFRAYNEGVTFCYTIPSQPGLSGATNLTEQTEFRFDADYAAWATYTAQGVYSQTTISGISSGCERPLPVELATNLFTALGEAGLVDYSRMKFGPLSGKPYSLVSVLDGPVTNALPLTTPWRFIMAADNPGQLVENNFLVLNLNAPCALTNTSWIKPGKVIREVTLTTKGGMACVDFAAKHNLSYIEFDAGWYGPENTTATATNVSGSLDLPGVISYGASNNVGVILYVNWLAMTNELSLLPPLYRSWGVKGIKYGFVSVGPQQYTEIVNAAARICASNQMMLDVHDEFRPSGYTRTYPNFMTAEGISGDETTPSAAQDTTLLFSRMLAGGADHTVCYFDSRVTNNWNCAYQLAKAVCFYSPWQFIYWYDRPTNSSGYVSGGNDMITEVPEMEFYDYMPAVWDETRVLQGSIGQYAIIARRTGTQWFIGAMNANSTRTFSISLSFLASGQKYVENVYSQDPSVPTRTHVRIDRSVVDSTSTLTMTLAASRGEAIRLLPANPPEIQSVSRLANGGFGLTITGMVSQPYSLWASPDLALPPTNWTLVSSGLISNSPFTLNGSISQTRSFYRCSTP